MSAVSVVGGPGDDEAVNEKRRVTFSADFIVRLSRNASPAPISPCESGRRRHRSGEDREVCDRDVRQDV